MWERDPIVQISITPAPPFPVVFFFHLSLRLPLPPYPTLPHCPLLYRRSFLQDLARHLRPRRADDLVLFCCVGSLASLSPPISPAARFHLDSIIPITRLHPPPYRRPRLLPLPAIGRLSSFQSLFLLLSPFTPSTPSLQLVLLLTCPLRSSPPLPFAPFVPPLLQPSHFDLLIAPHMPSYPSLCPSSSPSPLCHLRPSSTPPPVNPPSPSYLLLVLLPLLLLLDQGDDRGL